MGKKSKCSPSAAKPTSASGPAQDARFVMDDRFEGEALAESSRSGSVGSEEEEEFGDVDGHSEDGSHESGNEQDGDHHEQLGEGMLPEGFAGPSNEKIVKPLTPEALAAFKAVQERAGVVYISRIPPGMRPTKVRHLMSQYGEVGRVYLQQEDPKRAYLRRKYTATKKAHFTEGWVEFKDKKVARAVAEMLNAQPIGGKKGTRWRDDVWTMKYLPKFKWNMLTEQISHEAALHTARLRMELSQSRSEQKEYLRNVELARVLDKRKERKRKAGQDVEESVPKERPKKNVEEGAGNEEKKKKRKVAAETFDGQEDRQLDSVLGSIF